MSTAVANEDCLVSVIIPTFNRAGYIVQAVESVLQQQHRDPGHEVIVIDDGSTDETRQVLEPYASRIRYAYQDNAGLSAARNHGLRLARGEYVSFLDSDDWLLPGTLAAQLACMDQRRDVGVVQTGWRVASENGETLRDVELWHRYPRLDLDTWVMATPLLITAMLFRRSWAERVGGFDTELKQVEDVDFVLRLALLGCECVWVHRIGVAYRQHPTSMSRDVLEQVHAAERVLGKLFDLPELPESIRGKKRLVFYYRNAWFAWRLHGTGQTEHVAEYLRRSLACAPEPPPQTVLEWARLFVDWSHGVGDSIDDLPDLLKYVRGVVPLDEEGWRDVERLLPWWAAFWSHYLVADGRPPAAAGATRKRINVPELLAQAQQSLLITPVAAMVPAIGEFLQDARRHRLDTPLQAHDGVALYLTAFGQALLAGHPRTAAEAFGKALRHSGHPRAAGAWMRFVGRALRHATSGAGDAFRMWR